MKPVTTCLWMICLFALACEGPPAAPTLPDRGADLRGPVSPPPLHDLVAENREELGLSTDEERAIRQIADEARDELDGHHAEIQERREVLSALLEQPAPDRATVDRAIEELGGAETALRRGEIRVLLDIRARLSAEQRNALVNLVRQPRAPERRPPRPPPNAPPR